MSGMTEKGIYKQTLNSQDVLPTVAIDSPMDVEIIECRGPVTEMAGKVHAK
jgi:hypothetical protein